MKETSKMIASTGRELSITVSTGLHTPDSGSIINSMEKGHSTINFQPNSTVHSITVISIKLINAGSNSKVFDTLFRIICK